MIPSLNVRDPDRVPDDDDYDDFSNEVAKVTGPKTRSPIYCLQRIGRGKTAYWTCYDNIGIASGKGVTMERAVASWKYARRKWRRDFIAGK